MLAILPVRVVQAPTAAGLTTAQLTLLVAIVVPFFGLLLTAIGVMVLGRFSDLDRRLSELRSDMVRGDRDLWRAISDLRQWIRPGSPPPLATRLDAGDEDP